MKTRVLVVFGGQSTEHQVSCLTAAGVLKAIDREKFEVSTVGITQCGQWRRIPVSEAENLKIVDGNLPQVSPNYPEAVLTRVGEAVGLSTIQDGQLVDTNIVDVAFSVLHGPFGEDGTIQGMFEMLGLRYVGCGVLSSAMAMDKHVMKLAFQAAGLPVGPYQVIHQNDWRSRPQDCIDQVTNLDFPVFVKPARGGSSVGISRVETPDGLESAIRQAQQFDPKVIVEQGIIGAREIECAVLQGRDGLAPRTSKLGEIVMVAPDDFYDYQNKYLSDSGAELRAPTRVPEEVEDQIRDLAGRAFLALECEGLCRADIFLTADHQVLLNEINTMPGFTEISMFPSLWQVSGFDYPSLITELIELALERPLGLR